MNNLIIDINADVGEGIGNEAELLPLVSSCNIACGGHAGNDSTMKEVISLAKKNKVKIGAHPSYPDSENFGRKPMDISYAALFKSLEDQTIQLINHLDDANARLHHIKPHGALYNIAAREEKTATVIVELMKSFAFPIYLYVPYGSVVANIAVENNVPIIYEAFADRNYQNDLSLVSRDLPHALIHDPEEMFQHVMHIVKHKKVKTVEDRQVDIQAHTFCIHGDNPDAIYLLKQLRAKLHDVGIQVL